MVLGPIRAGEGLRWLYELGRAFFFLSRRMSNQGQADAYRGSLRRRILEAPIVDPPVSWTRHCIRVGGLLNVGFGQDDRFLLAVSASGRSVIDCERGTKVSRDYNEDFEDWSNPERLECQGIGPLANETIRMAGIYGGGLSRVTSDGWKVECVQIPWPDEYIVLQPPDSDIHKPNTPISRLSPPISEVRAVGFSPSGNVLVVATSSDLTLYRRED